MMTVAVERAVIAAPGRLRAWITAVRPATLPAAVGPIALGTALAVRDGRGDLGVAAVCLACAMALQIGCNLHNDAADAARGADGPDRLGPPRATARGWLSAGAVRGGATLAFAVAVATGLFLVLHAGPWLLVLGLLSVVAALGYTGGPAPLGYLGLGELLVLVFFGLVAVGGSYFAQAGTLGALPLLAAGAAGSLAAAILVVNNLRDRDGDRRAGKRTLVVRFGAGFGRALHTALVVAPYAAVTVAAALTGRLGWLVPLVSAPLAVRTILRLRRLDGAALNAELGGNARLALAFDLLLAAGVLL
jgi:1,4-dihydroxy-2-naphthoate polyprenyltransferase